jgi:hypothetical protein
MRIVFFLRHAGYVRNFESVLRELCGRGHEVHLAFGDAKASWQTRASAVAELERELDGLSYGFAPNVADSGWSILGRQTRRGLDYARYLRPDFATAPKLRARAAGRAPWPLRRWLEARARRSPRGLARAVDALSRVDRSLPWPRAVDEFLAERRPDAVLVSPLLEIGSAQVDYLRAAQAACVPTAVCVASWDNLTTKGVIRDVPDLVTVWNEAQRREAIDLHHIPAERVVATGAQTYDHWFAWKPSTTREEFCARVGLPANRPFLLYLGSSRFIAPDEAHFLPTWVRRVRTERPELSDIGVLVRPHPQHVQQWELAPPDLEAVTVWPPAGADPVDRDSRSEYYDSIYHAAAVVGVNTSALIESAIVGRTVHTLLADDFAATTTGTLHFSHLTRAGGGMLRVADSYAEHARQLADALTARCDPDGGNREFLEEFVRPHGCDQPAAPRLADAIEGVAGRPTRACFKAPAGARLRRLWLAPLAGALQAWRGADVQRQLSLTARQMVWAAVTVRDGRPPGKRPGGPKAFSKEERRSRALEGDEPKR